MNAPADGGGGPPLTREAVRANIDQWRQKALADKARYEPRVHAQIQRYFENYSPPWYASAIGLRRQWNLAVIQSQITGYASTLGRDLEDEETRALAEHTLHNMHLNAALKWAMVGFAGYMTYRGRRTWQFPFYKPKLGSRFNPYEANSIFGSQKIRGFYPQFIWHSLRFAAYTGVTLLFAEPAFRAITFVWHEQAMAKDPRLQQFVKEANARVNQVLRNESVYSQVLTQKPRDEEADQSGYDPSSDNSQSYSQSYIPETPSWNNTSQSQQPAPAQPKQSDDRWSSPFDDDDDASPIAPSSRSQHVSSTGGSAWDRIRQQSQAGPRPQSSQGSWGRVAQNSQTPVSWSADSAGTSPEYRGPRESYSYNNAEEEKATAKEQAQQEFDRLLERERQGTDQEKSWRRQ